MGTKPHIVPKKRATHLNCEDKQAAEKNVSKRRSGRNQESWLASKPFFYFHGKRDVGRRKSMVLNNSVEIALAFSVSRTFELSHRTMKNGVFPDDIR